MSDTIPTRHVRETLSVSGMDCYDCAQKVERAVARLDGVREVSVNLAGAAMNVEFEPARASRQAIARQVEALGYQVSCPPHTGSSSVDSPLLYKITGMDCESCASGIEGSVGRMEGVASASVSFTAATLRVELNHDADAGSVGPKVVHAVERAGYGVALTSRAGPATPEAATPASGWRLALENRRLKAALLAGTLWLLAWIFERLEGAGLLPVIAEVPSLVSGLGIPTPRVSLLPLLAYGAAIVLGGRNIAASGWSSLVYARTFDINLLMTVAVLGAASINQWAEGAAVVFLFSLGEGLEGLTMDRTRNSIRSLVQIAPKQATIRTPDGPRTVPAESLVPGDLVLVYPGDTVPADGFVENGSSSVNQAAITGESLPVSKGHGDEVFAGTLNERGYLEIRVTRSAEDTTLAKIIHLVEEAQASKAPSQRFVDRFARYYTPGVLIASALTALLPPLLFAQPFLPWFYRALVLLVVSCPCALVISTPVAIVAAIGNAARRGVLIKGGAYLEEAGSLRVIAFDKTGTLTEGRPEVTDVHALSGYEPEELVALAAVVEECSEHPLAAAVLRRRGHDLEQSSCEEHGDHGHDHDEDHVHLYPHDESEAELRAREISDFEAITGRGTRAALDGRLYYVGSPTMFKDLGVDTRALDDVMSEWQDSGKTALLVGSEETVYGAIAVADREREGAHDAVNDLKAAGIQHVVMLTGDNARAARFAAERLGVDEYRAGLLPDEKLGAIQELMEKHGKVGMVGDGINDAPALAAASVGFAMGTAGSDTALETADVALLGDDLSRLPYMMRLSQRALGIIKANIAFALGVKAVVIGLTFLGVTSLWLAILADTGASLLVIANGMRLLGKRARPAQVGSEPS